MNSLKQYGTPLLIFIFLALLFIFPIFQNISYWGSGDWDQHFFYSESARKSILEYRQFPFWNPWYCGGSALLAHPESLFLSPFFLINLIFGTVIGFKLQIFIHILIGMWGMWLLAQWYHLERISSYLPPILFMLGSAFANRVVAGHTLYLALAFIPLVYYFYLKSYFQGRFGILSALFLVVIIFSGGTYPFLFAVLLIASHASLLLVFRKSFKPLFVAGFIFFLAFGLGAVKLFPMLSFTQTYGLRFDDSQPTSLGTLFAGFLSFDQQPESRAYHSTFTQRLEFYENGKHFLDAVATDTVWKWHEYSAYIGLSFFLLLAWFPFLGKRYLVLLLLFSFFLVLYFSDALGLSAILRMFPFIGSFHGPSRYVNLLLFLGSLFAAMMLSQAEKIKRKVSLFGNQYPLGTLLALGFIILMIVNLWIIVHPLYQRAFPVTPLKLTEHKNFVQGHTSNKYLFQYPNLLQNVGTINCYDRLRPPRAAVPFITAEGEFYPGYLGEAWLLNANTSQNISSFTPNRIGIDVDAAEPDLLIVNQNAVDGWRSDRKIKSHNGLLAVPVNGKERIIFTYMPPYFKIGAVVSLLSFLFCIYAWRRPIGPAT